MKPIGKIIPNLLNGYGLSNNILCETLKKEWDFIFKEPLSLHTAPYKFTNGELFIKVDSHIWLNELNFLKNNIIEKLSSYGVRNVYFTFGKISKNKGNKKIAQIKKKDYEFFELKKEDSHFIEDTISKIENQELRTTIKKAITKSLLSNRREP